MFLVIASQNILQGNNHVLAFGTAARLDGLDQCGSLLRQDSVRAAMRGGPRRHSAEVLPGHRGQQQREGRQLVERQAEQGR
ncbi:hypothetical protein ACIPLC_09310 [Kitasatospora sp. NPDC086801]|uniref:hypothetical protein n=1 Tax=Kitasatospora sp. NPDC086801 TaxID=3364066 RepID=UPI0038077289